MGITASNAIKQAILQKLAYGALTATDLATLIRDNIRNSIAVRVATKIFNFLASKHLHRFSIAAMALNLTNSLYKDLMSGDLSMPETAKTLGGILAGAYAGWAGAVLGANAGAIVGAFGGPPGVVLGAALGALFGGLGAGLAGSWAGEATVAALYAQMKKLNIKPGDYNNSLMREQNKLVTSYTGRKLSSKEFYADEGVLGNLETAVTDGAFYDTLGAINFNWPRK